MVVHAVAVPRPGRPAAAGGDRLRGPRSLWQISVPSRAVIAGVYPERTAATAHRMVQAMLRPPSTTSVWPVMYELASLARNSTAAVSSAASPILPSGTRRTCSSM